MKTLISGARGLIGSELAAVLTAEDHRVVELTRRPVGDSGVEWSPDAGRIETGKLGGFDSVVHLAGEPVFGRWSAARKRRIRDSRVGGTRLLCDALAGLPETQRPKCFVCASAVGYYGDRGDEILTEASPPGSGFLAEVCREWEAACEPARQAGIRVVNLRIGLVLTPKGGLLKLLLPLFGAGLGGKVGNGRQWMSWIVLDDLVDVLHAGLRDDSFSGPINVTTPHPVTNAEFTKTLGRVLHRPTLFPAPRLGVKALLGEAADETALASTRVLPARLIELGHDLRYEELEPALRYVLGK